VVQSILDRWHFTSTGTKWFLLVLFIVLVGVGFTVFQLATDQKSVREIRCLALNIYHEARGESPEGQLAVATVTMNRLVSSRFPDNVCDVVRQYGWNPQLQKHISAFSWTGDNIPDGPRERRAWATAVDMAREVLDGKRHPQLSQALFYHADYVTPFWAKKKKLLATIGQHKFYP
jgi:spore germination cell wall hydrolase CwlJ-like protein